MKISLRHYRVLMIAVIVTFSSQTHAWQCDILTPQYNIQLPGSIEIQRDAPDNQPITDWIYGGGIKDLYSCKTSGNGGIHWNVIESAFAQKTGGIYTDNGINYVIFKTNISGIGIVIRARSKGWAEVSSYYSFPYGRWIPGMYNKGFTTKFGVDARLIKTGAIDGGQLSPTLVGDLKAFGNNGEYRYPVNVSVSGSKIQVLACSVNNPVVNVKFDQAIAKRDFKGVGYKLPSIPIPFTLTCNAGARVNVTINAAKDTSLPENGLIKIQQGENKAAGLAIQVTDKDENGITIGQKFILGTSTDDGEYDLRLRARYVQTSKIVSPGAVNSIATINLTYN